MENKPENKFEEKDVPLNLKFFLKIFLIIIALSVLTYFLFSWAMESVVHQRKEVLVPDIKGKSAMKALEILSKAGLAMQVQGFEFNESVPPETVLRQNPQSGIKAREGRIVKVVFSQGGESVFVPDLRNMPLRNAELLLRQRQLLLGEVTDIYSLKYQKGTVISQDPEPDTPVAKNTMVSVGISAGPPPEGILLMPDFIQKKLEDFYKWAEANSIKYSVSEDPKSIFPKNTIISQEPPVDTVLKKDTVVKITYSGKALDSSAEKEYKIKYQVSRGGSQKNVRIVAVTKTGDREILNAIKDPGSIIELSIPYNSAEKIRIYIGNVLVEERLVK